MNPHSPPSCGTLVTVKPLFSSGTSEGGREKGLPRYIVSSLAVTESVASSLSEAGLPHHHVWKYIELLSNSKAASHQFRHILRIDGLQLDVIGRGV